MIKTKKKNKYISFLLFVLSYIVNIVGVVCAVWASTVRSTIEYQLADELKNSDIAEFFGVSSELSVNVGNVDIIFYVGIALVAVSLIVFCVAMLVLNVARKQTQYYNGLPNVTYNKESEHYNKNQYNGQNSVIPNQYKRTNETYIQSPRESVYSEMEFNHAPTDLYNSSLVCISGDYSGLNIPVNNNEKIIFGNNPRIANVVLSGNNGISACHCCVGFDYFNNCYLVTDYSLNGTFYANGQRLPQNTVVRVCRGETIILGDGFNSFRLE